MFVTEIFSQTISGKLERKITSSFKSSLLFKIDKKIVIMLAKWIEVILLLLLNDTLTKSSQSWIILGN